MVLRHSIGIRQLFILRENEGVLIVSTNYEISFTMLKSIKLLLTQTKLIDFSQKCKAGKFWLDGVKLLVYRYFFYRIYSLLVYAMLCIRFINCARMHNVPWDLFHLYEFFQCHKSSLYELGWCNIHCSKIQLVFNVYFTMALFYVVINLTLPWLFSNDGAILKYVRFGSILNLKFNFCLDGLCKKFWNSTR